MGIITGEIIQEMCDYFIGTNEDFQYNPRIVNQKSKQIDINKYDIDVIKTLRPSKIFCYTGRLGTHFDELLEILKTITCNFDLYFHNSDHNFDQIYLSILDIPNLGTVYTQNLNVPVQKHLLPLPIGIANSMWDHGDIVYFQSVIDSDIEKTNHIYFQFQVGTNKDKRTKCLEVIRAKQIPFLEPMNFSDYLKKLKSFQYCICPEGNGLDTHRFWECLYLKVVPICLKNVITEHYANIYPIVLLDSWEDLKPEMLKYENACWKNYDQLFTPLKI